MSRRTPLALLLALLALLAAGPAVAEEAALDLDTVIDRYTEARGGLDAWRAAGPIRTAGSHVNFSQEQRFEELRARPDRWRLSFGTLGAELVFAHGPGGAWWRIPLYGFPWAWRTPPPMRAVFAHDAVFEPALMNWRAKGHQVTLVGEGDVEGIPAIRLDVVLAGGGEEVWYLDPDTYLEVAVDSEVHDITQGPHAMERRVWHDDFREVNGLVLPHRVEREFGARHEVITVEEITVGAELDGDPFSMPPPAGLAELTGLAGTWNVTVERAPPSQAPPDTPWAESTHVATIAPALDGQILRETWQWEDGGRRVMESRDWSWDRYQETYRLVVGNSFTGHLAVLEGGRDESGALVVDDVETGTAWQIRGETRHSRETISRDGDGLVIERAQSTDGGETWEVDWRATYERAE